MNVPSSPGILGLTSMKQAAHTKDFKSICRNVVLSTCRYVVLSFWRLYSLQDARLLDDAMYFLLITEKIYVMCFYKHCYVDFPAQLIN